ncbi:hypothetical protein ACIA8R_44030 [Nonomuraea sp. NPDC051191]|uniref:hypothetical protein n=1 Tax=Nonomuraea sp. NPDC051191 TaxID=3364372 RepID=UPI003788DB66
MDLIIPSRPTFDLRSLCLSPLWEQARPWVAEARVTVLILVLLVLRQMAPVYAIHIHL